MRVLEAVEITLDFLFLLFGVFFSRLNCIPFRLINRFRHLLTLSVERILHAHLGGVDVGVGVDNSLFVPLLNLFFHTLKVSIPVALYLLYCTLIAFLPRL